MSAMRKSDAAIKPVPSGTSNVGPVSALPSWVPAAARLYLSHTEQGQSLRALARAEGVHASTVMRQVRQFESRRDDPLVDQALSRLARLDAEAPDDTLVAAEATRILPLMIHPRAALLVAADMDKAVVVRDGAAGAERLAILEQSVAEAFALRRWIDCVHTGRVARYQISSEGRIRIGQRHPAQPAAAVQAEDDRGTRPVTVETPVAVLARRRDADGMPFLSPEMVRAADQMFESFVISGLSPDQILAWDRLGALPLSDSPDRRRARVFLAQATESLGPGLADVTTRCCCLRQGVETVERDLGWSARSGKIVLRIALQQLHGFLERAGDLTKMIG